MALLQNRQLGYKAVLLLACVALSACGTASSPGSAATKPSLPANAPALPGTGTPAGGEKPAAITEFARRQFPLVFTGLSVDRDGVTVHRLPQGSAALEQALAREFPGERLRFADSPRTADELDTLTRRVADDTPRLQKEGITVAGVGPDPVHGTVRVTVKDPETARARLTALYGPAITVTGPGPDTIPA